MHTAKGVISVHSNNYIFKKTIKIIINRGSDKMSRRSLYNPPLLSRQKRYWYKTCAGEVLIFAKTNKLCKQGVSQATFSALSTTLKILSCFAGKKSYYESQ